MDALKYITPKFFTTIRNYSKGQFLKDLIAGVIVAIIALPLSIALAIASGVNPEQGLYTAVVAGFFISFLGGSRVQIGGPTAAFVVIIYGIIAQYGMAGLTLATLMAGLMLIIMGLLRFGDLIKFIPKTITLGFTLGIAVGIVAGQVKDFLGLEMKSVPAEFLEKLLAYGKHLSSIGDLYTIKAGLPSFTVPDLSFSLIRQMMSPAFTIAILAAIESLLSCVVSDGMIGGNHRSNAELIGQGVGNIMSALFGGIPATGAIARTAANVKNGGRTPVAGMVHALTLLLILLFLMPYASLIPMTCLASILMIVGYNMSGWRTVVRMIQRAPKSDVAVLIVTFILTVFFDLVVAIEFGMVLAAFLFLKRMSDVAQIRQWVDKGNLEDPILSEDSDLKQVPKNAVVYEIFGALFFGAANNFLNVINDDGKNVLILRMRNVPAMDISGLDALEETLAICQKRGMTLLLSHVNAQPYRVLEKSGFIQTIGPDNICESTDQALEKAVALAKEA